MNDKLEKLAELEHVQWCDWAKSISLQINDLVQIIEKYDELSDIESETLFNIKEKLNCWDSLMIPYEELSEAEKDKDRVYAKKVLDVLNQE